jgi:lysozyme
MGSWRQLTGQDKLIINKPVLSINAQGLQIIKDSEGLKLKSYVCPGNVITIGYGHTKTAAMLDRITEQQAHDLLLQDVKEAESAIRKLVNHPININQFSALVSLVFNIGETKFRQSTLLKRFNAGDIHGAAQEFDKWVYAAGKKLAGLIVRRKKEKDLFLTQPVITD